MPLPQDFYLVPSTALQAVNLMLDAIGQVPIASLNTVDSNEDAEKCLNALYATSREVQSPGWHFNQEMCLQIAPDSDGQINLPANTLKVYKIYWTGLGGDTQDLVIRGTKLYDRRGHTFAIGRSVKVDLTIVLPFEDLPESARWYITVKAARRMAGTSLQSTNASRFAQVDEEEAKTKFEQDDAETDQRTLKGNPHIIRMRDR